MCLPSTNGFLSGISGQREIQVICSLRRRNGLCAIIQVALGGVTMKRVTIFFAALASFSISACAPNNLGVAAGTCTLIADKPIDVPPETTSLEQVHLEIELARLSIEERSLCIEERAALWNSLALGIPLVVAVLTLMVGVRIRDQQDRRKFQAKAAEIVMDARGPEAALNRAKVLAALFPGNLPDDFADSFDPGEYAPEEGSLTKEKFFQIVAPHVEKKVELAELWKQLFPSNLWTDRIR